jgi:hypothetical protein
LYVADDAMQASVRAVGLVIQLIRQWSVRSLIALGGAIGVLLVSPLLLAIADALLTVDWARLSEIGQSYTGVSALLSAVALVGVTISIRLQAKQTALMQQQRDLPLICLEALPTELRP